MIAYRPADELDLPFIIDAWVESYRDSNSAGIIHMDKWRDVMIPEVKRIISRPGCRAWVAYWEGETERINDLKGFVIVETGYEVKAKVREMGRWVKKMVPETCPLVHYLYVRDGWRRTDGHFPLISEGLLHAAGVNPKERFRYTCRTSVCSRLDLRNGTWSPLVVRFDPPKH